MPDIPRSQAALALLLADNTSGDISAQDVRDFLTSSYQPQGECNFRLGLEQDVWVSSSDQTGKSVIYVNAGRFGNNIGLYDGTSWTRFFPDSFALAGLTGLTDATNYDAFTAFSTPTHSSTNTSTDIVTWTTNPAWTTGTFVMVQATLGGLTAGTPYWYNRASATTGSFHTTLATAISGTSKVDLTANITQTLVGVFTDFGPAWSSNTSRGTGAGTTELALKNGVLVNSVSLTGAIGGGTIAANTGLYKGSFRTTSTSTVEDSAAKRFSWNNFNQEDRRLAVGSTSSHSYNGGYRYWNNSDANRVDLILGQPQSVQCGMFGESESSSSVVSDLSAVAALDVSNAAEMYRYAFQGGAALASSGGVGSPTFEVGIGFHFIAALEGTASSGTAAFSAYKLQGVVRG